MNTRIYLEMIEESTKFIRKQTSIEPRAGVILGSGLSKATPDLEKRREIPYRDIPGFPKTNVAGHLGRLIFGEYRGFPVAIMQGRLHYYEGHDLSEVTFPLRVLKNLGIQSLIITAAVGSPNVLMTTGFSFVGFDESKKPSLKRERASLILFSSRA